MATIWSKKATISKAEAIEGMMERECSWGGAYGRVLYLHAGQLIVGQRKIQNEICRGLRWPCYDVSHATTDQKHADAMERVHESMCNQGGARRGDETIVLGGIRR